MFSRSPLNASLREIAVRRSLDRRKFLRGVAAVSAAGAVSGFRPLRAMEAVPRRPKVVVVTFGGGARDEETFAPEGQENIPRIIGKLIPQRTFRPRW